ncbi:MAG: diaminopimelate epimerase [Gemmatimonadaceae bacterium]
MTGSGNDFVFFDTTGGAGDGFDNPRAVRALCARGTGVGADGVVFVTPKSASAISIRYFNSDGSMGELCGNATLCATKLAHDLQMVSTGEIAIDTDAGTLQGRMTGGLPEIDLAPVTEVAVRAPQIDLLPHESAIGFVRAGVPHIVILSDDIEAADVLGRGSAIRRHRSLRDGANVNFVCPGELGTWRMRTYERGVEGETLACGTGAVATAILLVEWGKATSPVRLETRSGRVLEVSVRKNDDAWAPSLMGNADVVFVGELPESLN